MNLHEFLYAIGVSFAAMFPMINPIGHAPMFYSMTEEDSPAFRHVQAFKTSLYTFLILAISMIAGGRILIFFGISLDDLRIAGGILVGSVAWGMLKNASRVTADEHAAAQDKGDISLTPMATPILAGPGAMSIAVGLLAHGTTFTDRLGYLVGFFAISLLTWICLRYSDALVRIISVNAIGAINRILGFLILALAVDLVMRGLGSILGLR